MTALFVAGASLVLSQTFIAKLPAGGLRWLFFVITGWPIGTIAAPVPSIFAVTLTICHSGPPCSSATLRYQKSKLISTSNFPEVIKSRTPTAARFAAWWMSWSELIGVSRPRALFVNLSRRLVLRLLAPSCCAF